MYSSLHRGKTTLADATYSDSLIKLATAREKTNKLAHTSKATKLRAVQSSDIVIEQKFMRYQKITSGLTRGSGMKEKNYKTFISYLDRVQDQRSLHTGWSE
ncbi:hypothetical protein DPMN_034971 [Dreissena polymorpha]|uniref:Uncharacterized protein n=1 Tax=Dreissena polymorpha TaxID=45954 RepID=A0A9D4M8E3_DREPO|nr:hypothetical protein DPMN_034971 [Dreissena polymorpha]